MPFRAELHYFFKYVQKYLTEKHGLHVERGDHKILTKALMDKVRDQILEADLIIGDITGANQNVFYELGLAHTHGKPVIFLTQDSPAEAPVDIRHFEFIHYELVRDVEFFSKLDNAIQNVFGDRYETLYEEAVAVLRRFNAETGSTYGAATLQEFQARVMRGEQIHEMPPKSHKQQYSEFLLPRVLQDATDMAIMRKLMEWVAVSEPAMTIHKTGPG